MDEVSRTYKPSPLRWYILTIFALVVLMQGAIWTSWSPISAAAKAVFPTWTDGTLAMFTNWGSITYLILIVPTCWAIESHLRKSMLWCVTLMAIGAGLRCIPLQLDADNIVNQNDVFPTVTAHLCAILNGIAGIVAQAAPPAISAVWFPVHERTTATGIGVIASILAISLSYMMGVEIVHDYPKKSNSSHGSFDFDVTPAELAEMRSEINMLMWAQAIPIFALAICTWVYFPNKPAQPPSRTSEIPRLNFVKGLLQVVKNPNAWLIAGIIAFPNAILAGWVTLMGDFLPDFCFSGQCLTQTWVNWLSVVTNIAAGAAALIVARITDLLRGHMKLTIILLLCMSCIGFTFLALITLKVITFSQIHQIEAAIYVLLPLSVALTAATIPLAIELSVEICFPAPEATASGWITLWLNALAMAFFFMFSIPGIGTAWLSYILPIGVGLAIPLAVLVKASYKRTNLDENGSNTEKTDETDGEGVPDAPTPWGYQIFES